MLIDVFCKCGLLEQYCFICQFCSSIFLNVFLLCRLSHTRVIGVMHVIGPGNVRAMLIASLIFGGCSNDHAGTAAAAAAAAELSYMRSLQMSTFTHLA